MQNPRVRGEVVKGYIIKEVNKEKYYCGSGMGSPFSGFYGAKIYKSLKLAKDALLKKCRVYGHFKVYEVEVTLGNEVEE